jgi:Protein of unknown function (DUF3365)
MRLSRFISVVLMFAVCASLAPASAAEVDDIVLGEHLAALLRAGRGVVSKHQDRINDPAIGDKGIDGESVVGEAVAAYAENVGGPPLSDATPEPERHLMQALMDSMREIVDEHEAEIDTPGLGFKGFIPAVYGRMVGERFAEKVGTEAQIKVTAPVDLVRNRKARPDDWERSIIEGHFLRPDWKKGEPFTEQVEVAGRPAFRILMPEYYSASCLTCHGKPAGDVDVTGYPKEGGAEGDLGGAISITLFK